MRSADSPAEYSDCSVTAAAVPDGNFSRSRLIMFRFIGIASTVPRMPRKKVQPPRTYHFRCSPPGLPAVAESISSAGTALTIVLPVA